MHGVSKFFNVFRRKFGLTVLVIKWGKLFLSLQVLGKNDVQCVRMFRWGT